MKNINVKELEIISEISTGSYAVIKKCEYNGKIYAYKEFYQPKEFLTDKNIKKYEKLSKEKETCIVSPSIIVEEDKEKVGYLANYNEASTIDTLKNKDQIVIIDALSHALASLQKMHDLGIIHCDVHHLNIIDSKFIDFDNAYYKNIKPNSKYLSKYAQEFLKKYGLCPELDIAMFNLLTYYMLTNISYNYVIEAIQEGNYSIFETEEQKEICENLLLQDKEPTKKLLLNTLK